MSVLSPMILMEFLLAPTVPSAPRPQNLQLMVPSGVVTGSSLLLQETGDGNIIVDTDGEIFLCSVLLYTAMIWPGVVSLEPKP